jgi:hypothetical protein
MTARRHPLGRGRRGCHLRPVGACLHRSCGPLEEVDLSTPEKRGQPNLFEVDWQSGVCGL